MSERARPWLVGGAILLLLGVVVVGLMGREGPERNRAYELEQRLRCPVCKSVSIAESPSETSATMRRIIETQVAAGRSDEEIIDYFRTRYGEWVLLDPPRSGWTLPLWVLPLLVTVALGALAFHLGRSRRPTTADPPDLTTAEQAVLSSATHRLREQRKADDEDGGP